MMSNRAGTIALFAGIGITVCTLLWIIVPPGLPRHFVGFLLAWIWPTITWSLWWHGEASERIAIAGGTALMLNAIVALVITYVPGATPGWAIMLPVLATSVAPLILRRRRNVAAGSGDFNAKRRSYLLLGLMIMALMLRLPGMGYKEFQGDEGVAVVRAASILTGDDAEWFNHQKGPMEIVLPLVGWGLADSINDYWARLPFTWAGLLAVLAIYWLGRKWFDPNAGLAAGLLFAAGGFAIAFSRIVQYQSLVMLWGALALLMATRYRKIGKWPDLAMSGAFLAAALLAHYDAVLAAPAVAWILAQKLRAEGRSRLAPAIGALAIAGLILALFYVPFLLSPTASGTVNYLLRERVGVGGGDTSLAGGLGDAWRMMTFYNSTWYVLGLALGAAIGILLVIKRRAEWASMLYFAVPALFYLLLVRDPRTHVYTIFPGMAILAGMAAVATWRTIRQRTPKPIRLMAAGFGAVWFVVVALYPALLFVDTSVERQRTWSVNRPWPSIYLVTWNEPPKYGLFGFPHQAGWRAAASFRSEIALPYGSNEEPQIADWYMAQAARTYCQDANTFLLVADAQDEVPYDSEWLKQDLARYGQVEVSDAPAMELYTRRGDETPVRWAADAYDVWLTPKEARQSVPRVQFDVEADIGDQIRLLGYDLDSDQAHPGGRVLVTLYWQALAPLERNYQVFVHLYDGRLWAQDDGAPNCDFSPTTGWEPGQIIADPHIIDLPADIPPGSMPIVVGMYDLITEDRLPVDGDPGGALELTEITIEATQ